MKLTLPIIMRCIRLFVSVFVAAFLFCFSDEIIACTCVGPLSPCEAFRKADTIFQGRVMDLSIIEGTDPNVSEPIPIRSVLFSVEKSWKGENQKEIRVITNLDGAACGYGFEQGKQYLVYAYRDPSSNTLNTDICTRTGTLGEAKDDIIFLDRLAKSETIGSIYGSITGADQKVLSKSEIRIEGESRLIRTAPNKQGRYQVNGLPSGDYRFRLTLPEGFDPDPLEWVVQLNDSKDCAEASFYACPAGRIEGVLRDSTGKPAAGIVVSAVPVEEPPESSNCWRPYPAGTDQQGRFIIQHGFVA